MTTKVKWKRTRKHKPTESGPYIVTMDEDSEECTSAVWANAIGTQKEGFFQQHDGRIVRVNPIAWAEMPKPYRPA